MNYVFGREFQAGGERDGFQQCFRCAVGGLGRGLASVGLPTSCFGLAPRLLTRMEKGSQHIPRRLAISSGGWIRFRDHARWRRTRYASSSSLCQSPRQISRPVTQDNPSGAASRCGTGAGDSPQADQLPAALDARTGAVNPAPPLIPSECTTTLAGGALVTLRPTTPGRRPTRRQVRP